MSQSSKMFAVGIMAALIGGVGVYFWQANKSSQQNEFAGVVKYNCEKSGGSFGNSRCTCPLELNQTQENMYDKSTGYCQSTNGGPAGDAFAASTGLPYGEYGYFMDIVVKSCEKSGGAMSGATCNCPKNKTYDKSTGVCK